MSDANQTTTGDTAEPERAAATAEPLPPPRVIRPRRDEPAFELFDPGSWLPADHVARAVWAFVEAQDLSRLYDAIKARGSAPGRPASDPAVLFAVWLLATIDGIGSARELERATRMQLPFLWLAQGVPVNYHGLADFRVAQADLLDDLLSTHLAALVAAGLANPVEIIIDGTKIAVTGEQGHVSAQGLAGGDRETSQGARRDLEEGRRCRPVRRRSSPQGRRGTGCA